MGWSGEGVRLPRAYQGLAQYGFMGCTVYVSPALWVAQLPLGLSLLMVLPDRTSTLS
jgi:hypothetical protein